MIRRPTIDEYFIVQAMHASSRGSCVRRRVGCILTNSKNHVLATGYNGLPSGVVNCTDNPCAGAHSPSGTNLAACGATHAEINALQQCPNIFQIQTAYVTASPCTHCIDQLLFTSCQRIVYLQEYPHKDSFHKWRGDGRLIESIYEIVSADSEINIFAKLYGFADA